MKRQSRRRNPTLDGDDSNYLIADDASGDDDHIHHNYVPLARPSTAVVAVITSLPSLLLLLDGIRSCSDDGYNDQRAGEYVHVTLMIMMMINIMINMMMIMMITMMIKR